MNEHDELIHLGNFLFENKLAWGNSGNISLRLNEREMLVTASGVTLRGMDYSDLVNVDIDTRSWTGTKKPTKEVPMHAGIYKNRPDVNVIIHSSPFWSTMVACSNIEICSELFIEAMYYLKDLSYVDYFHPGSQKLGEEVAKKSKESNILILRNHGIIVFDKDIKEAKMRIETLEMTSKMLVFSHIKGIKMNLISQRQVQDFLINSGYKQ